MTRASGCLLTLLTKAARFWQEWQNSPADTIATIRHPVGDSFPNMEHRLCKVWLPVQSPCHQNRQVPAVVGINRQQTGCPQLVARFIAQN
jgi:hypothetical protein